MPPFDGTLRPHKNDVIVGVFRRLAADSLHNRDLESLCRAAHLVLHWYQSGIVDEDQLFRHCSKLGKGVRPVD
jgi:hypothetical protein